MKESSLVRAGTGDGNPFEPGPVRSRIVIVMTRQLDELGNNASTRQPADWIESSNDSRTETSSSISVIARRISLFLPQGIRRVSRICPFA